MLTRVPVPVAKALPRGFSVLGALFGLCSALGAGAAPAQDPCSALQAEVVAANAALNQGDAAGARERIAAAARLADALAGDAQCSVELEALARVAFAARQYDVCRRIWLALLADREARLGADAPRTAVARCNVGVASFNLGDVAAAEIEVRAGIAVLRAADVERGEMANALSLLALVHARRGDLAGAIRLQTEALEILERELGAEHLDVLQAQLGLAVQHHIAGNLERAQELHESAIAVLERILPPEHPRLLEALQNLAATLHGRSESARALEINERLLAARERTLPEGDFALQVSRLSVAAGLTQGGEFARARALTERALEALRTTPGLDPAVLLQGRANLAAILYRQGDYAAAVRVQNEVLDALISQFGARHPAAIGARRQLATMLLASGDADSGRVLSEVVLPDCLEVLGPDHPESVYALQNLLSLREEAGDALGAVQIASEILASRERVGGDDPGARQLRAIAATRLARNEVRIGRTDAARERLAGVLADTGALADASRWSHILIGQTQSFADLAAGDAPMARERLRLLVDEAASWPEIPREERVALRTDLAWITDPDDDAALEPVLAALVEEAHAGLAALDGASSREAFARIARLESVVTVLASRLPRLPVDSHLHGRWFEILEELRAAGDLAIASVRRAAVPEDQRATAELARELRRRIQDLVAARGLGAEPDAARLAELVRRRDMAENELARSASQRVVRHLAVQSEGLRAALAHDELALLYREVEVQRDGPDPIAPRSTERRLLVHVVDRERVVRIDLGPAAAVRDLVGAWREAIARGTDRGLAADAGSDPELAAGRRVHATILAPALAGRADFRRLLVCPDGALHLAPFDALPVDEWGARLLERCDLTIETSLLGRLAPRAAAPGEPSLLALGGIDYNARVATLPGERVLGVAPPIAPAREATGERSGPLGTNWLPLPATAEESSGIAALFESAFERPARLLQRAAATKDAFTTLAEGARFLHVATHGYFADAVLRSSADAPREAAFERAVHGLAPSALCGLALTGANVGMDGLGRVPGVVTAEEIAALDLVGCELAVLSACDTGVGLVRPGRSPSTLHAALHAAGARVVVASLWKVPDGDTRDFFGDFYTRLWIEGLPPGAALRAAKRAQSKAGKPPRSWAAWVLTGDAG